MSLDEELKLWPATQPKEWMPKTIGFVQQGNDGGFLKGTISSPSRVDAYFDGKHRSHTG
jgi:hypothetical protein